MFAVAVVVAIAVVAIAVVAVAVVAAVVVAAYAGESNSSRSLPTGSTANILAAIVVGAD